MTYAIKVSEREGVSHRSRYINVNSDIYDTVLAETG